MPEQPNNPNEALNELQRMYHMDALECLKETNPELYNHLLAQSNGGST